MAGAYPVEKGSSWVEGHRLIVQVPSALSGLRSQRIVNSPPVCGAESPDSGGSKGFSAPARHSPGVRDPSNPRRRGARAAKGGPRDDLPLAYGAAPLRVGLSAVVEGNHWDADGFGQRNRCPLPDELPRGRGFTATHRRRGGATRTRFESGSAGGLFAGRLAGARGGVHCRPGTITMPVQVPAAWMCNPISLLHLTISLRIGSAPHRATCDGRPCGPAQSGFLGWKPAARASFSEAKNSPTTGPSPRPQVESAGPNCMLFRSPTTSGRATLPQ